MSEEQYAPTQIHPPLQVSYPFALIVDLGFQYLNDSVTDKFTQTMRASSPLPPVTLARTSLQACASVASRTWTFITTLASGPSLISLLASPFCAPLNIQFLFNVHLTRTLFQHSKRRSISILRLHCPFLPRRSSTLRHLPPRRQHRLVRL